jgi:probable HAF family extracellular repeat protein
VATASLANLAVAKAIPQSKKYKLAAVIAFALAASSAHAQLELHDLGHLDGSPISIGDIASSISADGQTVVGITGGRSFRWQAGTMTGLPGGFAAFATNADGSVVVGGMGSPAHAVRWSVAGGLQDLGALAGAPTIAYGVSADGSVIVGEAQGEPDRAWTWNATDGMHDIGSLMPGAYTSARGVSADGSVVVGVSWGHAFRWNATTGMIAIPDDLPATAGMTANAISGDGTTVVGTYNSNPWAPRNLPDQFHAVGGGQVSALWLHEFGVPAPGAALSVSTDGSRIVGHIFNYVYFASLWTADLGVVDLNDWLPSQGLPVAGWRFIDATGISGDGDAIVGVASYMDGSMTEEEPRLFLLTGLSSALPIFAYGFDSH